MTLDVDAFRCRLKAALDRIESGTLGLCCQCESEMEPERLEADPAVVFCTECMMARERRGAILAIAETDSACAPIARNRGDRRRTSPCRRGRG